MVLFVPVESLKDYGAYAVLGTVGADHLCGQALCRDTTLFVAALHHGAFKHDVYRSGATVFGLAGAESQYL